MELAERASAKHGERKLKVRMSDGHMARSTRQVADVKRPPTSVAKMVAAGNVCTLTSRIPGWSDRKAMSLVFTGIITGKGQTIRPVRHEGVARRCRNLEFDLGGVEDGQEDVAL